MTEENNTREEEHETENPHEESEEESSNESQDDSEEEESSEEESEAERIKRENEELKDKLQQYEARQKRIRKKKKNIKSESDDDDLRADVQRLKMSERKREFGHQHGLSPEETDRVFQINPNPSEKTLEDPFVKAGLDAIRRQKKVEDNTPSTSGSVSPVTKKDFAELSQQQKNEEFKKYMKERGALK